MIDSHPKQTVSFEYLKHCVPPVLDAKSAFTIFFSYNQIKNNRKMSHGIRNLAGGTMGGGFFHSKGTVPGDVLPARLYLCKLSSLAKGILFANFSSW